MHYLILFIATIFCANWAIATYGLVPVGLDLVAPAGVYFAGLAFTFRDLAQERVGRGWIAAAIVAGAVISGLVSTKFALASGVAFLVSELLEEKKVPDERGIRRQHRLASSRRSPYKY